MNKIKFPCFDNLKMVNIKKIKANDYNPNKMDRRMNSNYRSIQFICHHTKMADRIWTTIPTQCLCIWDANLVLSSIKTH